MSLHYTEIMLRRLERSLKLNEFDRYLMMLGGYGIETRDWDGYQRDNPNFTIEGIYEYYKKYPQSGIDKKMYDTLLKIAKESSLDILIDTILSIITFQLYYEKNNTAPFKIDCQSILDELRKTLWKHKATYQSKCKDEDTPVVFWTEVEYYNRDLCERFGYRLL